LFTLTLLVTRSRGIQLLLLPIEEVLGEWDSVSLVWPQQHLHQLL
jgi:hypothetical protein